MKNKYFFNAFSAEMSAYVDFSSSDESERQAVPAKRKRQEGSESGSDVSSK